MPPPLRCPRLPRMHKQPYAFPTSIVKRMDAYRMPLGLSRQSVMRLAVSAFLAQHEEKRTQPPIAAAS